MGAELGVADIRHSRGGREVLRVDELDVASGARLSVLGPNGAGKSTLLRLLAALEQPDHGHVHIGGVNTNPGGVHLRRRIAFATQRPALLSTNVLRNVELPLRWRKVPRRQRRERALTALERLHVAHLASRSAPELSGGEQQRVSLARALAIQPEVLLLDEPAAGLDSQSRTAFLADLDQALEDRATTVLHVSHRADEAMRLADRVLVLVDGQVHQDEVPEALIRRPVDSSVAGLVGYDNLIDGFVEADGEVLVGGAPTGLRSACASGPATVAVFAGGVRLLGTDMSGIPMRITRVTPAPGHRAVALDGAASMLATVPLGDAAPVHGEETRVVFEHARSVVLPKSGTHAPSR